MGSVEELSEAIRLAEEKRDGLQNVMNQVMLECKDAEGHFKMVQDISSECFRRFESKEKHLKSVQESVSQSCEEFDSKGRSVEERLKKLDEKEKFLKGVLQKIEVEKMQLEKMRDSVDVQLKDVVLKEQQFQGLKLVQSQVEKRENELYLIGKILRREDEIDSKAKELDIREKEVDAKERILETRQNVMDSEEKRMGRKLHDLDSKERTLARREIDIHSQQKMWEIRNFKVDSKEKLLEERENAMLLEAERLGRRGNDLHMQEKKLMNLIKELETKERILDVKLMKLVSTKNSPEQFVREPDSVSPTKSAKVRVDGRKRCMNPGICYADEGVNMEGNSSKQARRSCIGDNRFREQTRAHVHHLQKSGNVEDQLQQQDGLYYFVVTIDTQHRDRSYLTIPASFVASYDLSSKTAVMLLTDEGSFNLEVKHHPDFRLTASKHVVFRRGWREFYRKNRLTIGAKCLFKVREENVNGDASRFAMDVSILGR